MAENCLACDKKLSGRSDKKYCNDYCRSEYNNKVKGAVNNTVRNINNKLKRNRHVLSLLLGDQKSKKAQGDYLRKEGFFFDFHTHTFTNKKGDVYKFCYEYGYLPLSNDWYLIVKQNR